MAVFVNRLQIYTAPGTLSEYAQRGARIRSEVLGGISHGAESVPHFFLRDREERSQTEIRELEQELGDRVHILAARELENYLLVPHALLAAIRSKCRDDAPTVEKVQATSVEEIEQLVQAAAE